jgi:hypothetical protein
MLKVGSISNEINKKNFDKFIINNKPYEGPVIDYDDENKQKYANQKYKRVHFP